jgi:hypothetical protein
MLISTAAVVAYDEVSHYLSSASALPCRRLFGLSVSGNFPVRAQLLLGAPPADLLLTVASPFPPRDHPASLPLYSSVVRDEAGESLGLLYRSPEGELLRFSGAGDFHLGRNGICFTPNGEEDLAELRLLGPVFSYWFERRGFPTLHASAVALDGRAVAFLSRHGGGKSGLAAALVRAGYSLLADDLVVLEEREERWEVRPAYPEMRMWPDEASHFVGPPEGLPLVQKDSEKRRVAVGGGFGAFLDSSTPLFCIYLAARRAETHGGVEIQLVPRSEALIELVRHSFSPRLVEAAGLQPARLDRLARLVRSVPVRRLFYPSGFERLPEIAEILRRSW